MYPLAQAANPPDTKFLDPGDRRFPTLPYYDETHFKDIYDIVSAEPVRPRDKVMMGMLASIGIEPGKPVFASVKEAELREYRVPRAFAL